MKILIVGKKTKRRDDVCKILKETYADAELVFAEDPKNFEGHTADLYWFDELYTGRSTPTVNKK